MMQAAIFVRLADLVFPQIPPTFMIFKCRALAADELASGSANFPSHGRSRSRSASANQGADSHVDRGSGMRSVIVNCLIAILQFWWTRSSLAREIDS
jgi:hypothetical protein